jgi:hypothetical protein
VSSRRTKQQIGGMRTSRLQEATRLETPCPHGGVKLRRRIEMRRRLPCFFHSGPRCTTAPGVETMGSRLISVERQSFPYRTP